ncbi:hypothetical protein FIBSPDRAFT_969804 [Athelia psychrophila]|uniref:Uncharacterized protein n=1 Tax=Athelia psychrophila TaxID=1759441 RepID=A0A167T6E4_9AGAM|nr:hypothetical protein FIBSPDRAFT_969804 [Fibularhizoctonia sp. CBS 109695]
MASAQTSFTHVDLDTTQLSVGGGSIHVHGEIDGREGGIHEAEMTDVIRAGNHHRAAQGAGVEHMARIMAG